jgi:ubiquinone/menaquinone biosynthesis C-methylase UbiE
MNPYDRYVLPLLIDKACGTRDVRKLRQALVPRAKGRVLEIGIGTGHNLAHYDREQVTELIAVDPAEQMHGRARKRAAEAGIDVRVLDLPAERIPLEDGEVDTIVMTFTLCSIADPAAALAEMRRVLRPGGELLFCEHGAAPTESVRRWQRRLNPIERRIAGGCTFDVDVPGLIGAEFGIADLDAGYQPGPKFASYIYSGSAT